MKGLGSRNNNRLEWRLHRDIRFAKNFKNSIAFPTIEMTYK